MLAGAGLPVARVNQETWPLMQPLLANPALKPALVNIAESVKVFTEWMEVRNSSPLFNLQTAAKVQQRLAFHNPGPDQLPGLIVMSLSDLVEPDLDPRYEFIVVFFNANDEAQSITVDELAGLQLRLHPRLQSSFDRVVRGATFDRATGTFTVPARTTAVFVNTGNSSVKLDLDGLHFLPMLYMN